MPKDLIASVKCRRCGTEWTGSLSNITDRRMSFFRFIWCNNCEKIYAVYNSDFETCKICGKRNDEFYWTDNNVTNTKHNDCGGRIVINKLLTSESLCITAVDKSGKIITLQENNNPPDKPLYFELKTKYQPKKIVEMKDFQEDERWFEFDLQSYREKLYTKEESITFVLIDEILRGKYIYEYLPPEIGFVTAGLSKDDAHSLYKNIAVRIDVSDLFKSSELEWFDATAKRVIEPLNRNYLFVCDCQYILVYNEVKRSLIRYCLRNEGLRNKLLEQGLLELDEIDCLKRSRKVPNYLFDIDHHYPQNITEFLNCCGNVTFGEFCIKAAIRYKTIERMTRTYKQIMDLFDSDETVILEKFIDTYMVYAKNHEIWGRSISSVIDDFDKTCKIFNRKNQFGYNASYMAVLSLIYSFIYAIMSVEQNKIIAIKKSKLGIIKRIKYSTKLGA